MQRKIINFTWSDSQTGYGASNSPSGCANCFVQVFNPSAQPHVGNSHSTSAGWSGSCVVVSQSCKGLIPQNQQKPWEAANSCKQEPGFYGAKRSRKHWSTRKPNPFCEILFYYTSEALKPAINKLIAHFSLSLSAAGKSNSSRRLSWAAGIGNISWRSTLLVFLGFVRTSSFTRTCRQYIHIYDKSWAAIVVCTIHSTLCSAW